MPRVTTAERSITMKRTRNGILIPDVPIIAGGNLPNAVKGVSAGGSIDPYSIPFYIIVHTQLQIQQTEGLEISDDMRNWIPVDDRILQSGKYYFLSHNNRVTKPSIVKVSGQNYDIGGNINSLFGEGYKEDEQGRDYGGLFLQQNIVDAHNLCMPKNNSGSCMQMFQYCTLLRSAPQLPATILLPRAYFCMFQGCTSLVSAPQLPATTINDYCYDGMFNSCTSLVSAPVLVASVLKPYCYEGIFNGCTALQRIESHAVDITATQALHEWVGGVNANGIFLKKRGVNYPSGNSGIPTGWTVEEID